MKIIRGTPLVRPVGGPEDRVSLTDRSILIRCLFKCGLGIAYCRFVLAVLETTVGIVCLGGLLGQRFQEKLGVREGAVESPHHFNAYINGVKAALEERHPRLCQLMGYTIALLLYADDAAIPADTIDDLQLACRHFRTVLQRASPGHIRA